MQKICLYVGKGGERQEMKLTNQTSIRSALILPWWKGRSSFWICWVETKIFSRSLTRTAVGMYVSFLLFMTDWSAPLLCWLFDGLRSTLGISLEQQGFLVAQTVKNPPAVQETQVWSLGWEDPPEKGMATHSSILAWRISRTEEPGWLQSMGSQRVGHDWANSASQVWDKVWDKKCSWDHVEYWDL